MFAYFENHAKLLHNMKDCVGVCVCVWQVHVGILEFIWKAWLKLKMYRSMWDKTHLVKVLYQKEVHLGTSITWFWIIMTHFHQLFDFFFSYSLGNIINLEKKKKVRI